jgi:hypothetical protein
VVLGFVNDESIKAGNLVRESWIGDAIEKEGRQGALVIVPLFFMGGGVGRGFIFEPTSFKNAGGECLPGKGGDGALSQISPPNEGLEMVGKGEVIAEEKNVIPLVGVANGLLDGEPGLPGAGPSFNQELLVLFDRVEQSVLGGELLPEVMLGVIDEFPDAFRF